MNKRFSITLLLVLAAFGAFAQEHSIKVTPVIKQVTVFLTRAQLKVSTPVELEAGTNEIVLTNQTVNLDPQSIQVSGKGDFVILSVVHEVDYLKQQVKADKIKVLEDSIEYLNMIIDFHRQMNDVRVKEEQMILANQSIKGQNTNLTAAELEHMADFFRDRLDEIREEIIDNNIKIKKMTAKVNSFNNQLNEYNRQNNQPSSNIIVTVSAKTALTGSIEASYITGNAGWYPVYDIRAKDAKSPVQLAYKAQVYQNTGYDWKNVRIKLSTNNPSVGGNKPELGAWYVDIYDPVVYKKTTIRSNYYNAAPSMKSGAANADMAYEEIAAPAGSVADYTTTVETTLSVEFDIAIPYTVTSGGKGQLVDVKNIDLPATYEYAVVPKLDLSAFLLAHITDWGNYSLISGDANVYFEGTYVGKTFIDIANTKDTLNISLGRDARIVVERNIIKDFSSKKMIGLNRKEEYGYEIVIRNTKKDPITIIVEDQYPISKNSQLEVEVIDVSGAVTDVNTGKLTWKLTVAGAETKKLTLKYAVKYPKDKNVSGL